MVAEIAITSRRQPNTTTTTNNPHARPEAIRSRHRSSYGFLIFTACILSYTIVMNVWLCTHESTNAELLLLLLTRETNNNATPKLRNGNGTLVTKFPYGSFSGNTPQRSKWAYAFLLAACNPENSEEYIGMIYNVLVATHNLRNFGVAGMTPTLNTTTTTTTTKSVSKADIIVLIQLSPKSLASRLLKAEEHLLNDMQIRIYYLPKPTSLTNFYTIQFEKFHILHLTEYSRIIMMDGDVMPYCNLDYLFELSEETCTNGGGLQENVILAWKQAPAHGGFFLLKPQVGDYEQLQGIIQRREEEALLLPYPHFDEKRGWGHVIQSPDRARFFMGRVDHVTKWNWYGVFAEQGLLYYWTKYVKHNVSIIIGNEVEHWVSSTSTGDGGKYPVILENEKDDSSSTTLDLSKYACLPKGKEQPGSYGWNDDGFERHVPYVDFAHFTGDRKPWEHPPHAKDDVGGQNIILVPTSLEDAKSATEFWFYVLEKVLKPKLHLPVDIIENISNIKPPPVGRFYNNRKMSMAIHSKHYKGLMDAG